MCINCSCLYGGDEGTRKLWSTPPKSISWTLFSQALLRRSSLEEVALFIPGPLRHDWYCEWAPTELCKTLELGFLQRVGFVCGESNHAPKNLGTSSRQESLSGSGMRHGRGA